MTKGFNFWIFNVGVTAVDVKASFSLLVCYNIHDIHVSNRLHTKDTLMVQKRTMCV